MFLVFLSTAALNEAENVVAWRPGSRKVGLLRIPLDTYNNNFVKEYIINGAAGWVNNQTRNPICSTNYCLIEYLYSIHNAVWLRIEGPPRLRIRYEKIICNSLQLLHVFEFMVVKVMNVKHVGKIVVLWVAKIRRGVCVGVSLKNSLSQVSTMRWGFYQRLGPGIPSPPSPRLVSDASTEPSRLVDWRVISDLEGGHLKRRAGTTRKPYRRTGSSSFKHSSHRRVSSCGSSVSLNFNQKPSKNNKNKKRGVFEYPIVSIKMKKFKWDSIYRKKTLVLCGYEVC